MKQNSHIFRVDVATHHDTVICGKVKRMMYVEDISRETSSLQALACDFSGLNWAERVFEGDDPVAMAVKKIKEEGGKVTGWCEVSKSAIQWTVQEDGNIDNSFFIMCK